MIREAMQFLTGLKEEAMEPKVVEIAGKTYCNKNLQRYDEEPTAKEMWHTLQKAGMNSEAVRLNILVL